MLERVCKATVRGLEGCVRWIGVRSALARCEWIYIVAAVDHSHLSPTTKHRKSPCPSLPLSPCRSDVRVMSISILETGRKAPASMVIHWFDAPSALQKV